MSLTLIHLPLDMPALHRWAKERFWAKGELDEGRALHHLLSECFGKGALQPFRLMVGQGGRQASLYAYTDKPVEALRELALQIALPEMLYVIDLAGLRGKPLPKFRAGQRLGFDVTCLPTRRLRAPLGDAKKGSEVDAWLVAKHRHGSEAREEAYLTWLAERLDGACVDKGHLAKLLPRKLDRKGVVAATEVTLQGTLTICDPAAFTARLARGVGRHRAYGFGMVMLRAPGAPVPGC